MTDAPHRAGVVAILGRPNAGKSTLMNRLLGQKLAIVTPKPQTTRSRILGILTLDGAQVLFVDTPGRHAGAKALNVALNEQVEAAAEDCDLALLLVDLADDWGLDHDELMAGLEKRGRPVLVLGTQSDRSGAERASWPARLAAGGVAVRRLSARTGEGVDALLADVVARLPESPALYPSDQVSDRPLRFLAAELVREAAFRSLSQELPYALAVEVVEFDESRADLVRIRANLLVERASQKKIVIGTGGSVIRDIGIAARREIERLLDAKVHLELWVKLDPKWARSPKRLKSLGYS